VHNTVSQVSVVKKTRIFDSCFMHLQLCCFCAFCPTWRFGLISLRYSWPERIVLNQRLVSYAATFIAFIVMERSRHPGRSPQTGLYRDGRNSGRSVHSCADCPALDPALHHCRPWNGGTEQRRNCTHKAVDLVTGRKVLEKLVNVLLLFVSILCALLCFLHSKRLLCMNVNVIKDLFGFSMLWRIMPDFWQHHFPPVLFPDKAPRR
jgi:hypothetical protein